MSKILTIAGGAELVIGALMMLKPEIFPAWATDYVAYFMIVLGLGSIIFGLFCRPKDSQIPIEQDRSVKLESSSNSGIINTGDIHQTPPTRRINVNLINDLVTRFSTDNTTEISYINNSEAEAFAREIRSALEKRGFTEFQMSSFMPFNNIPKGQNADVIKNEVGEDINRIEIGENDQ